MSPETPNADGASNADAYSADAVQILSDPEHIRRRPGMYIGDCGVRGLHHLVYELVGNSLNEAVAGCCKCINVELLACGGCRVSDDGRGLPVEKMKDGRRIFEALLTHVFTGPKFDQRPYRVELGLRGIGLRVVNALSTNLVLDMRRDGRFWRQWFQRGSACHAPHSIYTSTGRTGTRIAFWPDRAIFREDQRFQFEVLAVRLREQAALHKGVTLRLTDHRGEETRKEVFYFPSGLADYYRHVAAGHSPVHANLIHFHGDRDECRFEVAMQWTDSPGEVIYSFVNGHQTLGGTHVSGVRYALTAALRERAARRLHQQERPLTAGDFREGLIALVAITTPEPWFQGSTKQRLANPEFTTIIGREAGRLLGVFLDEHLEDARAIIDRVLAARRARLLRNRT